MNGENSSIEQAKAEKIAAAKRKLREFESRRVNGGESSSSPVPSMASNGGMEYTNGRQSVHSQYHEGELGGPLVSDGIFQALEVKTSECETLKKQLADLHVLYSQAYSAYNELAARESGRSSAHGETQIVQLQSALALLVEEKTDLLSRLRMGNERVGQLEEMLRKSNTHAHDHTHSSREEQRLRDELIHAHKMVAAHSEELNNLRRENATTQSATRGLQQDKSEAQARLRGVYQEKERLEGEVKELRKELASKEMNIRQLRAHGAINGDIHSVNEHQEDELRGEVESLRCQLEKTLREAAENIQLNTVRERNLSQRVHDLMNEVSTLSHELSISRVRVSQLEDDVESARGQIMIMSGRKDEEGQTEGEETIGGVVSVGGVSEEEATRRVDETARRITMVFEERLNEEREEKRKMEEDKDRELERYRCAMEELKLKMEIAERKMAEDDGRVGSLHDILQDLQNEKATVSRALTQNRELKEQVIALEDRLIVLTDEKLKSELERQALEFELKGVKERQEEDNGDEKEREKDDDNVSLREKELEGQLGVKERMLQEMREELRRSQNENDSMNAIMQQNGEDENQNSIVVELTQAVGRVNTLTQENNELRERLEGGEMQQRLGMLETQLRFMQQDNEMLRGQLNGGMVEEIRERIEIGEEVRADGHESQLITVLQERLASAEDETARLIREGVERMEEMEGRIVESEMRREKAEEKYNELERKLHSTTASCTDQVDSRLREVEEELEREKEERKKLEHVRTALEQENETIADHVILYQHYRTVMRERLRAKDVELREAEIERQRIAHTCTQLQQSLNAFMQHEPRLLSVSEDGESRVEGEGGDRRETNEGDNEVVTRIHELLRDIQTIPPSRMTGIPKCTQCIGRTLDV